MPYSAIDIANFFITRALGEGKKLTPMQVVKMTYIAHGWNLGILEQELINEPVQAWKFGPVVPSVYFAFKGYGGAPIDSPSVTFGCEMSDDTKKLLNKVYDVYTRYTGSQLSELTHEKGTPWELTVREWVGAGKELPRFLTIPTVRIKDYYRKILSGRRA